jgi:hypothetical protein
MKSEVFNFKVLIKKDEEFRQWVGQCLELDLVAVATRSYLVARDLSDLIYAQLECCLQDDNMKYFYHPSSLLDWRDFFSCKSRSVNVFSKGPLILGNDSFLVEIRVDIAICK